MTAARTGRPSKYSPERAEAILTALRSGNTRTAAAGAAGIGYATLQRWMATCEQFRSAIEKAAAPAAAVRFVGRIVAVAPAFRVCGPG